MPRVIFKCQKVDMLRSGRVVGWNDEACPEDEVTISVKTEVDLARYLYISKGVSDFRDGKIPHIEVSAA